jgi:integrase
MARSTNRLTARTVTTLKVPGRHADGGGLYLHIDTNLAKRWVFVFQWHGKRKEMGLGNLATVPLAEARDAALDARRAVVAGTNPIEARRIERGGNTFGDVADGVLADLEPSFSNAKHRAQWATALKKAALPLRAKRVDEVTTEDVLAVLRPLWSRTPETASRLRGRIERVLDAAKAKGLRTGENPARWRGHLDVLLPRRRRMTRGHHAALPFEQLPAFLERLRVRPAVAARALEFTILTAARTGETLGARWSEIDMASGVWTVPAERMKARTEHRVPLTPAALAILKEVRPLLGTANDGLVFPGQKRGRPLSQMAMVMLMRRMEVADYTVHGFRSTFRDWAGDATNFAREVVEAALAHTVGNAVERAYRRSDAFAKRQRLMEAWAGYCAKRPDLTTQRRAA